MPTIEPRAYTPEEVRQHFLDHICRMISYWNGEDGSNVPKDYSSRERLEGLAHSILVMIDGRSGNMPAFDISPSPHPDDKEYLKKNGENWYEPGEVMNNCQLHDQYNAMNRRASHERKGSEPG